MRNVEYEDWLEKYRPIKNHLDNNAAREGLMFETFGPELDFVQSQPKNKVWTLVDTDDGTPVIISGYYYVNRLGYFVTEAEFVDDITVVD